MKVIETIQLRDYQTESVRQLRAHIAAGRRKLVLSSPTGSGKTELACDMIQSALRKGSRALFIVDRVVLVDQASARMDRYGIPHGVLQAGHWRWRPREPVQVCSAQTLERRGMPDRVDVVFIDESHILRVKIVEWLRETSAAVIGLTATPFSKGLGQIYQDVVNVTTTDKLVADGHLKPLRYYSAAASIDTKGLKVIAGEWSEAEIEQRGRAILGDIVQEWIDKTNLHFGGPRKTIVFIPTVDYGVELAQKFREAGYDFRLISYKDANEDRRREIFADFAQPNTTINGLMSCEVLTRGFDVPDVQVGVLARPYRKSLSSHIQQLGRVMRPYPDHEFGLILDHCGNVIRFHADTMEFFANGISELDDGKHDAKVHREPTEKERSEIRCACGYILRPDQDVCPACGKVRRRRNLVEVAPGELVEIDGNKRNKAEGWPEKIAFMGQLKYYAWDHHYADGWVVHKYRERYGCWPNDPRVKHAAPLDCTPEVLNFIRSRQIAYARSKRRSA